MKSTFILCYIAIYKGLLLTKDMNNVDELACYSDFLHCVNLIKGPQVKYHIQYSRCIDP
jgi:hypothetical protein